MIYFEKDAFRVNIISRVRACARNTCVGKLQIFEYASYLYDLYFAFKFFSSISS